MSSSSNSTIPTPLSRGASSSKLKVLNDLCIKLIFFLMVRYGLQSSLLMFISMFKVLKIGEMSRKSMEKVLNLISEKDYEPCLSYFNSHILFN